MEKMKRLNAKLMAFVLLLAVLLIAIAMVVFGSKARSLANSLMEEQLKSACYLVDELLGRINSDDFSLKDGQLYKGDVNLTARTEEIDKIGEMTGLAVTIMWGDVRKSTTVKDDNGNRIIDTTLSADTAKKVLAGESRESSIQLIINHSSSQVAGRLSGLSLPVKCAAKWMPL